MHRNRYNLLGIKAMRWLLPLGCVGTKVEGFASTMRASIGYLIALLLLSYGEVRATERTYRPVERKTDVVSGGRHYVITFQSDLKVIRQTTARADGFQFDRYDWDSFFQRIVGNEMDELKQSVVESVTSQFAQIADHERLTSDQLLALASAFVSALSIHAESRSENDDHFYQPYELLLIGPRAPKEQRLLLASLLSELCFEIQFVAVQQKWNLSVLGTAEGAAGMYKVDGRAYLLTNGGGYDNRCKGEAGPCSARVVEVDEICSNQPRYRPPVRRAAEFDLLPELISDAIEEGEGASYQASRNGWSVDLASVTANFDHAAGSAAQPSEFGGRRVTSQAVIFGGGSERLSVSSLEARR